MSFEERLSSSQRFKCRETRTIILCWSYCKISCHFSGKSKKKKGLLGSLFKRSSGATPGGEDQSLEDGSSTALPPKPKEEKMVKVRQNNSNNLVLCLGALAKEPLLATGDPCVCTQCGAAVSSLSQLTASGKITTWNW